MSSRGFVQHLSEVEKRRSDRDDVFLQTMIRLPDGRTIAIDLLNVSRHGFMARAASNVAQEVPIRISLPSIGERGARTAWALGNRIGAEFITAIDPASYFRMIEGMPR